MKLLWDNNDKDKSSYLRLHHFMTYYPFKNDIFDNWGKDRKTVLHISDYDKKKKMEPKYQNERKSSGTATNTGTTSNSAYQEAAGSTDAEADPF